MIEEVKKIFDDIRDGIIEMGGDITACTSPEEYAEAIKGLSGNNAVLFIPCFKASDTKPETPTKTMSPADPTDYPEGWGTPDNLTGKIWMTYTIVSVSTVYVPWTEPVLLGAAGESPVPPVYDPQVTRTFVICLEVADGDIVPHIPTGGHWDVVNNILEGPIKSDNVSIEWSTDNDHVPGGFTWMSVGTFLAEDGSQIGSWSEPMCINSARDGRDGVDGRNGVDGTDVEFIYKLFHSEADALREPTPITPEEYYYVDDYVPGPNPGQKGYWSDQPFSIDPDEYPVEVMCQRKKNVVDPSTGIKKWGDFIGPVIWSSWGNDGMDGDGIEYIFRVATESEVSYDSTTGIYSLKSNIVPSPYPPISQESFLSVTEAEGILDADALAAYQEDEWVPGHNAASLGWDRNWYDDPQDVSSIKPFEFCSIRKWKYNETSQKYEWTWFSTPKLWARFYGATSPIFNSVVYTRSKQPLGTMELSGGDINNPVPDAQYFPENPSAQGRERIVWYRYIPGATEYASDPSMAVAPIWTANAIFGNVDPNNIVIPDWSSPVKLADNKFFNVEYSDFDLIDGVNTILPTFDSDPSFIDPTASEGVNEGAWRTYCSTHDKNGNVVVPESPNCLGVWTDTMSDPKWMATCTFNEGVWSEWTITQVKGEDGINGLNQATVTLYKAAVSVPTVPSTATTYTFASGVLSGNLDGWSQTMPSISGSNVCWSTQANAVSSSATVSIATGDWSTPRQLTGTRGPIGPKMRMRNWDYYTSPDVEDQSGWKCGDNQNDAFYDIAIYPPAEGDISIESATSDPSKLWRCIQNLDYANVPAGSNPSTLPQYFTQAVGWDFVATKLLLAERINANQIDVAGLSTDTLVTTEETDDPQSYIHAQGNTFTLFKTGNPSCIITADNLSTDTNTNARSVWKSPLGEILNINNSAGASFTKQLGEFKIFNANNQNDEIYSEFPQFLGIRVTGVVKSDIATFGIGHNESAAILSLRINIINKETGVVQTWNQTGYAQTKYYIPYGSSTQYSPGDSIDVQWSGFEIDTSQCEYKTLDPGWYSMELTGDVYSTAAGIFLEKCNDYRIQVVQYGGGIDPTETSVGSCTWNEYQSWEGYHSPIIIHHQDISVNRQTTEIAANGFGHVLDTNNYFLLKHPVYIDPQTQEEVVDDSTLMLEFLANGLFGIQISKDGIKYTTTGPEHWATWNTP